MKISFLLVLESLLACLAFAAITPAQGQPLSENLQLTQFSISPPSVYQGDLVEFSLGVKSAGSTATSYDASLAISDTSGQQVSTAAFLSSKIAGGETQELSKIWDTSILAPGNYSVLANVTDSSGASKVLLAHLEILPAKEDGGIGKQGESQAAAAQKAAACSSPAACGEFGNCIDNYTTQQCTVEGCPEKDFYVVQHCGAEPAPIILRAEGKICKSASFLCTENQQEDWLTSFCLSGLLAGILLGAALFWRTRHYGI